VLEVAIGVEMEADENRHNLTVGHLTLAVPMLLSVGAEGVFFDTCIKFFAKIICDTENFINFVGA
jgi:hypothetical protein